jgi:hypothetical protein
MALPVRQEDDLVDAMQASPLTCVAVCTPGAPMNEDANGVVAVQLAQNVIDQGRFIKISPAGYE